nr:MAG TPA: hypothetical protein [Bacteriophage sp.]
MYTKCSARIMYTYTSLLRRKQEATFQALRH